MPMFLIAMFIRIMVGVVQTYRDTKAKTKPEPRCVSCAYAHVQYTANARRAISCAYGGSVRPMKLDVLYCTDYENRYRTASARSMGFVREIAGAD